MSNAGEKAGKRILKELKDLQKSHPTSFWAGPVSENLYYWEGTIIGPKDSPYAGGVFSITVRFPRDYPVKPPRVQFRTKVFHPNICSNGCIRLDILTEGWSLDCTISKVLLDISSLLKDPKPDEAHPNVPEIKHMCKTNWAEYVETARLWTELYAMP